MLISQFQILMRQLYFERDSERGTEGTLDWLEDELEELREALKEGNIEAAKKEFADVFAWLASLANVVNIDLETATLSKYNNKCPKCEQSPCNCHF